MKFIKTYITNAPSSVEQEHLSGLAVISTSAEPVQKLSCDDFMNDTAAEPPATVEKCLFCSSIESFTSSLQRAQSFVTFLLFCLTVCTVLFFLFVFIYLYFINFFTTVTTLIAWWGAEVGLSTNMLTF